MRIYEFSKQVGVSVKEIIELLQGAGFTAKSHMSALQEQELAFLKKKLENSQVEEKKEKVTQPSQEMVKSEMLVQDALPKVKKNKPELELKKNTEVPAQKVQAEPAPISSGWIVLKPMSVGDFAVYVQKPVNEVIITLLKLGIMATKNQTLSEAIVSQLAKHYDLEIRQPSVTKTESKEFSIQEGKFIERHPVIVVIGHVDHGKTTLLDFIRKTKVAAREKGGITQHLGAYEATTEHGKIVFLDTPGHEAFTKIRQRGIKIADIAILVVAADDGVMPQTIEAINHAKRIGLPIIVAITKIDKVDKIRVEAVKRALSQYGLLPEEWGGTVVCVPVSAITGEGIDHLLEMVLLQAQMMELRAAADVRAQGYILESKVEKGRGSVATVLAQNGTVRLGDYFISGDSVGRVNALIDSYGKRIQVALPATPVQVSGFEQLPRVGDPFEVVTKDEYIKFRSKRPDARSGMEKKLVQPGAINLIIKADNNSSQEAIVDAIMRLKGPVGFNIINAAVGDVSESDVDLAADTGAIIVGFNVKPELNATILAQRRSVTVDIYGIIYRLLDALQLRSQEKKEIETVRKKIGEAIVRQVFTIKDIGVIAGCYVKDGRFTRDGSVVVWRGNRKVGEGKIKSLQREKKSVKEVHAGFECGFLIEGFDAWLVDDRVECYIEVPKE